MLHEWTAAESYGPIGVADAMVEKFGGDSVGEARRDVQSYLANLRFA